MIKATLDDRYILEEVCQYNTTVEQWQDDKKIIKPFAQRMIVYLITEKLLSGKLDKILFTVSYKENIIEDHIKHLKKKYGGEINIIYDNEPDYKQIIK